MDCHKMYSEASAHQIHLTTQNLQSVGTITKTKTITKEKAMKLPKLPSVLKHI